MKGRCVFDIVVEATRFPVLKLPVTEVGAGRVAADFIAKSLGDAVHGFPLAGLVDEVFGGIAESRCCQGTFGPTAIDVGNVPLDEFRGCVTIELVADVDESLYGSDVHVVDGGEVEDNRT